MPDSDPSTEVLTVGQRVVVLGKRKGTVRFVGSTAFGPGCNPLCPCQAWVLVFPCQEWVFFLHSCREPESARRPVCSHGVARVAHRPAPCTRAELRRESTCAGEWVGVELDKPTGSHDGGAHGHRYFTCSPPPRPPQIVCLSFPVAPSPDVHPPLQALPDMECTCSGKGCFRSIPGRSGIPVFLVR